MRGAAQVQKKIGACVEDLAAKVLRQASAGGGEAGEAATDEDMPQAHALIDLQSQARQLLSARTLL